MPTSIYEFVGAGFNIYATDRFWLVGDRLAVQL